MAAAYHPCPRPAMRDVLRAGRLLHAAAPPRPPVEARRRHVVPNLISDVGHFNVEMPRQLREQTPAVEARTQPQSLRRRGFPLWRKSLAVTTKEVTGKDSNAPNCGCRQQLYSFAHLRMKQAHCNL